MDALKRLLMLMVLLGGMFFPLVQAEETAQKGYPSGVFPPPPPVRQSGDMPCLACAGKGEVASALQSMDTRSIVRNSRNKGLVNTPVFMVACKQCKGRKVYHRALTLSERMMLYRKQRAAYDTEHLTARHLPIGAGYLEKATSDQLSPEEFALIAAQMPAACKKCYGFGALPCTRCDSMGQLQRERTDSVSGERIVLQEPCSSCSSTGQKVCSTCETTGLARVCGRCKGRGIQERPATKSRPASVSRCASCSGTGRR